MSTQQIIMACLFLLGTAFVLAAILSYVAYQRYVRREEARLRKAKTDIADLSLLFKTMRDIIKQQKRIAREFNEELDTKAKGVKQLLAQGVERNERLYEQQRELAQQIREAREELASVQRQTKFARDNLIANPPAAPVDANPEPLGPAPVVRAEPPDPDPDPEPDELAGTGLTKAPFTEWSGDDLASGPAPAPPLPVAPPEAPEDADAARDAFRALLDMEPAPAMPAAAAKPAVKPGQGNGDAGRLRTRVLEYSEAGMSVQEIARELGIGKGEVRLALSLAKQHRP